MIYDSWLDKLVICQNYEKDNGIAYHEFWHWLWYKRLSDYERWKYKRIMDRENDCITDYACTSLEESFAENTRFVLNKGKVDTDKKKFIRWLLRKYEVYY